ncbi:solute carrier family 22 member 3-like [Eupeodes corollae]|uniref:solute carrier family 22 member 3-like n=1 Tax=Eupeodes corollae TaxID=290404 RepID=UPI0024912C49|nr:solute carrier family 22 member 3-like [Eupeodes corollae]
MSSNENGCVTDKKESIPTESRPFGLDDILVKIGEFGKFQFRFVVVIIFLIAFHTIVKYGFIFTASTVVYRCRVPECDGTENFYQQPWTDFTIPKTASGQLEKCQRFKTFNSTNTSSENVCYATNYDQESRTGCGTDFIFRDKEVTIAHDFKVFCSDEWKLAIVGSTNNLGQVIGIPLGGYISDRYGRSKVLACAALASAIIGVVRSFSINLYMFAFLGCLDNVFGSTIYGTAFVLAMEFIGPNVRSYTGTLLPMFGGISRFLLGLAAKNFLNWRLIERILYIPALGFIALPWILPESVRWLLSHEKEEEATKILRRAAKINKRKLSDASIEKLLQANRKTISGVETNKSQLVEAFKVFPWRIMNCSFCWFSTIFIFMGLSLNLSLLGRNRYNSFMYLGLIEIPGTLLPPMTINRFGRKYSLCGFMFLTGIFITAMTFVPSDSGTTRLVLYLLGKMFITGVFQIIYIFTSEVFPTSARNSLLAFCSMFGRFGSMIAPQTPLMAKYYASAPGILFASSAFLSGSLVLFLPETNNVVLPTTLKDAENIGQKEIKIQPDTETEAQETLLTSKAEK